MSTSSDCESDATKWLAPAKLNLFLHIVGRRDDGYHLLQTAIQFIDVCDELSFTVNDEGEIRCMGADGSIRQQHDLTVRAARLLQEECSVRKGVDIHLKKVIPTGAGFGGGSSDAATVLLALNRLWECGLDTCALETLGAQLGADVPVFVRGEASWVEGVGERLQAMEFHETWYVAVFPRVHLDTREMFAHPELVRDCIPIPAKDLVLQQTQNVFEPIARQHAQIEHAWQWLSRYSRVRLTGSGSSLYAPCKSQLQAEAIVADCPQGLDAFAAKSMNRSPVYSLCGYNRV
ncbi:MAG: 4-(cytidine 5'-diphospho)-2-C-methyl-D-erythritol kinase [Gammaproteobacteria bacterium]|nr:4-(cytidine 5'-diphospho)-2-C-methyl-D-erythritol kinase [Gammaproteobacteria bacterium]